MADCIYVELALLEAVDRGVSGEKADLDEGNADMGVASRFAPALLLALPLGTGRDSDRDGTRSGGGVTLWKDGRV